MTPGFFFHKSLLEGMNVYDSDLDEDDQFFISDDEGEVTGDTLGTIQGEHSVDSEDAEGGVFVDEEPAEPPTRSRRAKPTPENGDTAKGSTPKTKEATRSDIQEAQKKAGYRELYRRLDRIAGRVVEAYTDAGLAANTPEIAGVNKLLEDGYEPEALLNSLEKLGIAAKAAGLTLGDGFRAVVPPDIITTIFFLEIPEDTFASGKYPIISDTKAAMASGKISANVAGLASATGKPFCSADGNLYGYLEKNGKQIAKDKISPVSSKIIKEDNINNVQISHLDHPPSGRQAFYLVPTPIYEAVRDSLANNKVFSSGYNLDDLAAEVLFLGTTQFFNKYHYPPKNNFFKNLPSLRIRVPLGKPCYATFSGNKLVSAQKFVEYLRDTIIRFCIPGQPGMIFDAHGKPMPKLGKEWYDILNSAKPTAILTNPDMVAAAKEGYLYQLNMDGEYKHIFNYFVATSALMSSDAMADSAWGKNERDKNAQLTTEQAIAIGKKYSDDMIDSGDEAARLTDVMMREITSDSSVRRLFRNMGLEMPDIDSEQPVVNMKRMTTFLVAVSRIMSSKFGVHSTITTEDGIHPLVNYDAIENSSAAQCPIVGIWKHAVGGELAAVSDPEVQQLFGDSPVYRITEIFFRWLNTYAGDVHLDVGDTYRNLFVDDMWEQARDAFTPDIRITELIADIMRKMGDELPAEMLPVVRRYAIKESAELGVNFLTDTRDLMSLLQYISEELYGMKFDEGTPENIVERYNRYLYKIVSWNVQIAPNGRPTRLVPPEQGRGNRLISFKPEYVLDWVRGVLMGYNNANEVIPIIMGFMHYAAEMSDGGAEPDTAFPDNYDSSELNGFSGDSGSSSEFQGELGLPLASAIDRYDPDTRGATLYTMMKYASGGDDRAIKTINAIANLDEPLTDYHIETVLDGDLSEAGVKHAVDVLNSANGINFPELAM